MVLRVTLTLERRKKLARANDAMRLLGPPCLGKSHIAQAIGYAALMSNYQELYCPVFKSVHELRAHPGPAWSWRCT